MNVSSFSFRSFEIDSNYYAPIQDLNITLESIASSAFSPLKTSSPNPLCIYQQFPTTVAHLGYNLQTLNYQVLVKERTCAY